MTPMTLNEFEIALREEGISERAIFAIIDGLFHAENEQCISLTIHYLHGLYQSIYKKNVEIVDDTL